MGHNLVCCFCCCKNKTAMKFTFVWDCIWLCLLVVYTVIAAASLGATLNTLRTTADYFTYEEYMDIYEYFGSYEEFLDTFESVSAAFVLVPAIIIDVCVIPRILAFVFLKAHWKSKWRRQVAAKVRTVTHLLMLLTTIGGIIAQGILTGKGVLITKVFATIFIVLFIIQFLIMLAIDIPMTVLYCRYAAKAKHHSNKTHHKGHVTQTGGVIITQNQVLGYQDQSYIQNQTMMPIIQGQQMGQPVMMQQQPQMMGPNGPMMPLGGQMPQQQPLMMQPGMIPPQQQPMMMTPGQPDMNYQPQGNPMMMGAPSQQPIGMPQGPPPISSTYNSVGGSVFNQPPPQAQVQMNQVQLTPNMGQPYNMPPPTII